MRFGEVVEFFLLKVFDDYAFHAHVIFSHQTGRSNEQWDLGRCISMYFLLKIGDIPASYVSLPEGIRLISLGCITKYP